MNKENPMHDALVSYIEANKREHAQSPKAQILGIETNPNVEQGIIKGLHK